MIILKDVDLKEKFVTMRAKNISFEKIAEELGVNKNTLVTWSRHLETQIANLKAIELDKLQTMYLVAKEERIRVFGKKLQEILQELEGRDLSEVPTEALFSLALKYGELLKKEEVKLKLEHTW